jgi:D-beta-D-heptose 7-phosphate kinase/D-beta-D-heptose 1-phosphate adenosyltransferase
VILNSDNWLIKKKGYVFMPEKERKAILEALRVVDKVVLTRHKKDDPDGSVCKALYQIRPDIFANGGDRNKENIPEVAVCNELGTKMVFNVGGGKVQSSSWLTNDLANKIGKKGVKK